MSNSPSHDQPRRIGDYFILRVLGQGGMGTVYEAEEQLSRRHVALKILRSELSQTVQGRRQFVSEMGILASLDDPHIVRCLHCTEIEGQLVMVLEYLEGRTLREVLTIRGCLSWNEVARFAWQIASALRVAHSRQPAIIHRDLKPENVMCLPDGRLKVMDFGIAKIVQTMAGTTTSFPVGTLQYMSPEQIDARPVDARSDLYALGLVMWEMLAGRPPFEADSPRVLLEKSCIEPAPRLPDHARVGIPPNLEYLIARLLEKDPNARPRDAQEVLAILDAARPAPVPVVAPVMPAPAPSNSGSAGAREVRPANFDTIAIVQRANRRQGPPKWIAPVVMGVGLVAAAGVLGVAFVLPRIAATTEDEVAPASVAGSRESAPAAAALPAACEAEALHWQGAWEFRTEATVAVKSSWVGGRAIYDLELDVKGCSLSGSGRKRVDSKQKWAFSVDGTVADDGTAKIHYEAEGRNIEGTWSIARSGSGTWTSAADDVSGTVTASRVGG